MNYEHFHHENKDIFLVDMKKEQDYYFSELFDRSFQKYLHFNKRILLFLNKTGFDAGILCQDCGYIPQCHQCSVPLSFYQQGSDKIGLCHICKTQYPLPDTCPNCQSEKLFLYGMGMQKLTSLLQERYKTHPFEMTASSVNSFPKLQQTLPRIQDAQVVVSTSLLTQPIRGFDFDLIIFFSPDGHLSRPSFDAHEKLFWQLYETYTKHPTKNFLVQTYNPDAYSIRSACKLNYEEFSQQDKKFRQTYNYPPYTQMAILLYKHETERHLYTKISTVKKELLFFKQKYHADEIEIYDTPASIYKVFGKYRYHIILKGDNLRSFLDIIISKLRLLERGFKIDRMPTSIS